MFAGLVEELGTVVRLENRPPGMRLVVSGLVVSDGVRIGDSIAINGCCLTVIDQAGHHLAFDAGPETLRRTNLGELSAGSEVNLERSLVLGDRLGGHFVTGHVDGLGRVISRQDDRDWSTIWFHCGAMLSLQMASKGSVAVDGVSLTLVDVTDDAFSVALIPHTLKMTTLGRKPVGGLVNLETDLLAKYVYRQLHPDANPTASPPA